MKNRLYTAFCVLFLFFGIAHTHERDCSISTPVFTKCEKIYVQPEQVALTPEGIYFQFEDSWIMTDAIHCDSSGIFISSTSSEWSFSWTCPKCGTENGPLRRSCKKCGHKPRH
jgi:predicted RNA-binding Zn-ribbon protein involved in translation (DUF1610 family)